MTFLPFTDHKPMGLMDDVVQTVRPVGRARHVGMVRGFLVFLLVASGLAMGLVTDVFAQVTLQLSVDRSQVDEGDVVQLTVSVEAQQLSGLPTPELPTPNGFQLIGSTSSTSTSISIVNGSMTSTRTTTYVFSYRARQEGTFTFGPARMSYDNKNYTSDGVQVSVVKGSGQAQTRPNAAPGESLSSSEVKEMEENLFLQALPDKKSVYVGEQVGVTYKLYTRYNLQNVRYGQVPTFTGFWAETLFDAQRLDLKREVVDGRAFNAAELKRMALFPTTAGQHTLEQLEVVCDIPVASRSRGLFDFDPFGSFDPFRARQVTVRSADVTLMVKSLPAGAPSSFNGAVGHFEIRADAAQNSVKAGDPISVKVTVTGMGNLHTVSEPSRPNAPIFRFYDPKTELTTQKQGDRLGGQKTFEYVVIPQKAGAVTLPPFRLAYFDPERERYETVSTAPIALRVLPGEKAPEPIAGMNQEQVRVLGEDIRYIKPDQAHLVNQGPLLYERGGFWLLQFIPLIGFVGAYVYRRHQARLEGDVAYARRRRARSDARKRLSEANRLLTVGDSAAFHAEIHRSLAQFLADRLNRSAAGLTSEQAATALSERKVPDAVVGQVRSVFSACDMARFAPGQARQEQLADLFGKTETLIDELGRHI